MEPAPMHSVEIKGFTYTSFTANGFLQGGLRNTLGKLKSQISNNWIAICVFEYQSSPTSADIAANTTGMNPLNGRPWSTTSSEIDIREGVRQARSQNMKIMLKPHVDLYTGEWRAAILPDNQGIWFTAYTAMMEKYARLAQELNIEMLCIGTEYVAATQPMFTLQWRKLIDTLRMDYSGQLTYAANWSGDYAHGLTDPEFRQLGFWKDVDNIGVDVYYPLAEGQDQAIPAYGTALNRAIVFSQQLRSISFSYKKSVIITEIGIQSVKGALAAPWNYSLGTGPGAVPDNQAQEFYYRVMIDAIGKQVWCSGLFWWHWESVGSACIATNYTPEDKPAAQTLRQWYIGPGI